MDEIVVGVDRSETARRAAERAAQVSKETGRGLHLVASVPRTAKNMRSGGESWHLDSVTDAEQFLTALAQELGVPDATHGISFGDPATAMCDEAERLGAWVIVVGNKRVQGASRVLGSVAMDVARKAPCDLLIVHTVE
jgi:nucleotide-binding universal stress UspA family protein